MCTTHIHIYIHLYARGSGTESARPLAQERVQTLQLTLPFTHTHTHIHTSNSLLHLKNMEGAFQKSGVCQNNSAAKLHLSYVCQMCAERAPIADYILMSSKLLPNVKSPLTGRKESSYLSFRLRAIGALLLLWLSSSILHTSFLSVPLNFFTYGFSCRPSCVHVLSTCTGGRTIDEQARISRSAQVHICTYVHVCIDTYIYLCMRVLKGRFDPRRTYTRMYRCIQVLVAQNKSGNKRGAARATLQRHCTRAGCKCQVTFLRE